MSLSTDLETAKPETTDAADIVPTRRSVIARAHALARDLELLAEGAEAALAIGKREDLRIARALALNVIDLVA